MQFLSVSIFLLALVASVFAVPIVERGNTAMPEKHLLVRDLQTGTVVDLPAFVTAVFNGLANTILATGNAAANTIAATGGAVANGLGRPLDRPTTVAPRNNTLVERSIGDLVNRAAASELERIVADALKA